MQDPDWDKSYPKLDQISLGNLKKSFEWTYVGAEPYMNSYFELFRLTISQDFSKKGIEKTQLKIKNTSKFQIHTAL